MKLMFLDESGDHNLSVIDPQYPLVVLGGVIMDADYVQDVVAPRMLAFKRAILAFVQCRLDAGKRQPHQRVEDVMPFVRPELHFPAQKNTRFVAVLERRCARRLRDKPQRQTGSIHDGRNAGGEQPVEIIATGPGRSVQFTRHRMQRRECQRLSGKFRVPRFAHALIFVKKKLGIRIGMKRLQ